MTKKIKLIAISLLTALCIVLVCLAFLPTQSSVTYAESEAVIIEGELNSGYVRGQTITIPKANVVVGSESYEAEKFKVVTPSGSAYGKKQLVLNETGIYTIYYYKTLENVVWQGSKTLKVVDTAYTIGTGSTAAYGTNEKMNSDVFGLNVALAVGEKFEYNIPINLTDKTNAFEILRFYAMPLSQGSCDANEIFIQLTDAYDSTNVVTIRVQHADFEANGVGYFGKTHIMAKAGNQSFTGMEITGIGTTYPLWNGNRYVKNVERYGMKSNCSLTAEGGYGKNPFYLSMDYEAREVYSSERFNKSYGAPNIVADLDNSNFFSELWGGFTTGECYLSIYTSSFVQSHFNFFITNIAGNDLFETEVSSQTKPSIIVDGVVDDVYAIVDEPFKIFSSYAMDVNKGIVDCNVEVLYNNTADVYVYDGKFTPKREGKYVIKYSVEDLYGNYVEKIYSVYAYNSTPLSLEFGTKSSTLVTGQKIKITLPTIENTSGEYQLFAKACSKNHNVQYELAEENGYLTFVPLYSGNYEIIYTCRDYIGEHEFVEEINVGVGTYYLEREPIIEKYLIKDVTYAIDNVLGYNLSSGEPVVAPVTVKYAFDDGQYEDCSSDYKLKITASDRVKLGYFCGDNLLYECERKVFDVGYGTYSMKIGNYFYSADNSLVQDSTALSYLHTTYNFNKDGASAEFINRLSVSDFTFAFSVPSGSSFGSITIRLTDGSQTVDMEIVSSGSESFVKVNGVVVLNNVTDFISGTTCTLGFKNGVKQITFNGKANVLDDSVFEGFSGNSAYLSMIFNGVVSESQVEINKVNNQVMCGKPIDDAVEPILSYNINSSAKEIGEKLTITDICALDVLSPETQCVLSVISPSGAKVTSDEGVLLDKVTCDKHYIVSLSEYGNYVIKIQFSDNFSNGLTKSITVTVVDRIAPTIDLDDSDMTVDFGSKISIRSATVSDNIDSTLIVKILIISPTGIGYNVADDSFTVNELGTFKVFIYAIDSSYNVAYAMYNVHVV